jgi:hypothetical protein
MADCGENDIGGVALASPEVAATEMAFGLHMADHGFDGGATSELALDDAEDPALLA